MPRYVALLGSVNVGGHTVKMERLRELFAGMGFSRVETFIASGNVIFDSPETDACRLAQEVETSLQVLGFPVPTYLRTTEELAEIARCQPFAQEELEAPNAALYILFLRAPASAEAEQNLRALRTPDDEFQVRGREVYWLRREKISETRITGAQLAKALGGPSTNRNATTVRKLAAKYPPSS